MRLAALSLSAVLLPILAASPALAQTIVGGGYHGNLAWTKANSPYRVTSDVILFPGFVLTLEPGTEVQFESNTGMIIRGEIRAIGTAADSIRFTAASGTEPAWNGIRIDNTQGGNGVFRFVHVSQAVEALGVECCWGSPEPLTVSRSRFTGNAFVTSSYAGADAVYDSCVFEDNHTVFRSADKVVRNSLFRNNRFGLMEAYRIRVSASTFVGNAEIAVQGGSSSLDSCRITGSRVGVMGAIKLNRSIVEGNDTGFIMPDFSDEFHGSRFDNALMNLVYQGSSAKDLSGNWWGSTDPAAILAKLRDGRTDDFLGPIAFSPYWADTNGTSALTYSDSIAAETSTYGLFLPHTQGAVHRPGGPKRNPAGIGASGGWVSMPLPLEQPGQASLQAEDLAGRRVATWRSAARPGSEAMSWVFVPGRILGKGRYVLTVETPGGSARVLIRVSP